jgi:hypothetical protein
MEDAVWFVAEIDAGGRARLRASAFVVMGRYLATEVLALAKTTLAS